MKAYISLSIKSIFQHIFLFIWSLSTFFDIVWNFLLSFKNFLLSFFSSQLSLITMFTLELDGILSSLFPISLITTSRIYYPSYFIISFKSIFFSPGDSPRAFLKWVVLWKKYFKDLFTTIYFIIPSHLNDNLVAHLVLFS